MIKIYKKTLKDTELKKINKIERGSWILSMNPIEKEVEYLVKNLGLDFTVIEDGLDENEISRVEVENNIFYMIIRFPVEENEQIMTMPMLVAVTEENIVTLCKMSNNILDKFTEDKIPFHTTQKTNFLLKIILEVFNGYDHNLNKILKDIKLKKIKIDNLKNKDILFLVQEEEALNDFNSSLIPAINILEKILSGRYITIYEKDRDIIEDLVMDSKQTLELSRSGLKTIKNIREAYSTIVTNELNRVMRILTTVTIILTVPTIVSSIYGMNVALPFEKSPYMFFYIIMTIILLSVLLVFALTKRKWI